MRSVEVVESKVPSSYKILYKKPLFTIMILGIKKRDPFDIPTKSKTNQSNKKTKVYSLKSLKVQPKSKNTNFL